MEKEDKAVQEAKMVKVKMEVRVAMEVKVAMERREDKLAIEVLEAMDN